MEDVRIPQAAFVENVGLEQLGKALYKYTGPALRLLAASWNAPYRQRAQVTGQYYAWRIVAKLEPS